MVKGFLCTKLRLCRVGINAPSMNEMPLEGTVGTLDIAGTGLYIVICDIKLEPKRVIRRKLK